MLIISENSVDGNRYRLDSGLTKLLKELEHEKQPIVYKMLSVMSETLSDTRYT